MTSPALAVLFLALVYSSIGTTSEQTADHDSKQTGVRTDIPMIYPKNLAIYSKRTTKISMETERTNFVDNRIDKIVNEDTIDKDFNSINNNGNKYDEIYTGNEDILISNLEIQKVNLRKFQEEEKAMPKIMKRNKMRYFDNHSNKYNIPKRRVKRDDPACDNFIFKTPDQKQISHPVRKDNSSNTNYASNIDCYSPISGNDGQVVVLTFVDIFHIEDHPKCAYDYLEIRDGPKGYSQEIKTLCGNTFPRQIVTTGPDAWLKFHSDDTIEYEGFKINVNFIDESKSHRIHKDCYMEIEGKTHGTIGTDFIEKSCKDESKGRALDVLWSIRTPENTKIYLNFTAYDPKRPNECEHNLIQVFGSALEYSARLAHYCGLVANPVATKGTEGDKGNEMHVRFFASINSLKSAFNATFTAFRSLDLSKDEKCDETTEFDCEDNTCIAKELRCDKYAHCRLKTDEDVDLCKEEAASMIGQPHILVILVIFSLILSGMSFVFLFKCIRKLYQDHKIIKEHIRQSCEDRLDGLVDSHLTQLDAKGLQRVSESRGVSLERENHTNEIRRQRSFSKHKPSSIESDFLPETILDPDDALDRDSNRIPVPTEVRIEHNGRSRRSDTSKREESLRSKSTKESNEHAEKKEIRDVSVGAPDTKESSCQTRESLFQKETAPSSDGSGSHAPGFSTFGYSGATIIRPSPPPTNTSEITIELLSQVPQHPAGIKLQKKMSERRPMSAETTRSAPDVIIVSKPIR